MRGRTSLLGGLVVCLGASVAAAQTVDPMSITSSPSDTCGGGSEMHQVCITLPPDTTADVVDIMLLFDDTGSFAGTAPSLIALFTTVVSDLQTALPAVDFAFGVSRFEDYGGPGADFSFEFAEGRPFTLNQAIIRTANATFNADIAAALGNTAPGFGGDGPETAIAEGLFQLATGAGFDGDGNASNLDSGPAGALATQTAPGVSGDVPAFSSYVGTGDGTLGGAGWRAGSFRIVLLATDVCSVAAFDPPAIPGTVTGTGGTEPTSAFACFSTTPGDSRFGFVSDSKTLAGNTVAGAVVPSEAATVPATVAALNALGIRVIGLGPGAGPTASTAPSFDESVFLSALARLTGALDGLGDPLVFDISGGAMAVSDAIVDAIQTATTAPIDIILTADPALAGLTVSCMPAVHMDVMPGDMVCFDCTFTGDASFDGGMFDLNFRDQASNSIIGTIPVTLECPCFVLDFQTEDDFATALFNGQDISTPPEFGNLVAISASGPNAGAAIFDSTPTGPNDPSQDTDLLVGCGNILILQNDNVPGQSVGGFYDFPNDDTNGGTLTFDFLDEVAPVSLDLIDIDGGADEATTVVLTDAGGATRTYSVPPDWTGDLIIDGTSGKRTLDLQTLADQAGFGSTATASQDMGFDSLAVVRIDVNLGSSGGVDNVEWCLGGVPVPVTPKMDKGGHPFGPPMGGGGFSPR